NLRALKVSQNIIMCSIILNSFNVQMPPRREPDHPVPSQATVVAQFRDYHAEKFSGQGDPRVVDEWIQGLEFIFEVMECPERYRVFLSLRQGTRTVDEYEREFTRLATFVPDLVRTEAQREQRFIDGLYPAVRHNILGHGTQTYARAVSIAQEVDASIRREAVRGQSSSVPPVPALPSTQPPKNNKRKDKGAQADKRARQRRQQIPQCPTCGRHHRGECHLGQDVCYYCHEPGHFANRCPKKAQQPQQPQRPL
ncbi:Unknown protein, partial [Striga hermonthica]